MTLNDKILKELQGLKRPDGLLMPEDVVEFAKDPTTALHSQFCWDDTEAARRYRLLQAHEIIRVTVKPYEMVPNEIVQVRAFESLDGDRRNGGGYREIEDIFAAEDKKNELLETARKELIAFRERYKKIANLLPALMKEVLWV